jgi:glycosyltransferase involved in cell wall biosynthesis
MIAENWINWPFAINLLNRCKIVIVHNQNIHVTAKEKGIQSIVVGDLLPEVGKILDSGVLDRHGLVPQEYVIVPWKMMPDEPIVELVTSVRRLPKIKFVMAWFTERLPKQLRCNLPDNLICTGYLQELEFDDLYANAAASVVLTTQEGIQPSAASEAIAFGVPLVLSDFETARSLYRNVPVYVDNDPESIVRGIVEILGTLHEAREELPNLQNTYDFERHTELENLKHILANTP